MVEVEETDGAGGPSPGPVHGQGHSVGQVLVDPLVADHPGGVDVLQLEDDPVRLGLGEPLVEAEQGSPQAILQQHLSLTAPLFRQSLPEHVGPPQPFQQLTGGVLRVVELVEFVGGGHRINPQSRIVNAWPQSPCAQGDWQAPTFRGLPLGCH